MSTVTKLIAPVIAAGTAALTAGSVIRLYRSIEPIPELPEEPVSSYAVHAQELHAASPVPEHASAEIPLPDQLPESGYTLKLHGDTLRIYEDGKKEPVGEYDLPAGWLPDYDRILLEYGFRVGSRQELRELIEDYVS